MNLIADAGSTKTAWRLFLGKEVIQDFTTNGINPLFMTQKEIEDEIEKNVLPFVQPEKVERVYFFGAGCSTHALQTKMYNALSLFFSEAYVMIGSDLEAAAMSLFGKTQGVACIIGTGSNAGFWDGNKIVYSIPSLGFILGDEGSATWIGKQLILAYFRKTMPSSLQDMFENYFSGDVDYLLKNVYHGEKPNLFLASITEKFIQINHAFIDQLLTDAANVFFDIFIKPFPLEEPIGFIGSIAKMMEKKLFDIAQSQHRRVIRIDKNAIEGLHQYFINH